MPQARNGVPVSADTYRAMVNAVGRAVHAVRRDNVVVAGGLAPFGGNINDPRNGRVGGQERIHPMEFMRRFLCMSAGSKPRATCNQKVEFDVWGHHPYTFGGPTHKAFHRDDVSLGDLDKMSSLLDAAKRVGHIRSRSDIGFWVTEFSYDSRPGDPMGLPLELHARWVSEALYRMWSDGVSLVTWFLVYDQPFPQGMFQSGLYTRGRRSEARTARFPVPVRRLQPAVRQGLRLGPHALGQAEVGDHRAAGRRHVAGDRATQERPLRHLLAARAELRQVGVPARPRRRRRALGPVQPHGHTRLSLLPLGQLLLRRTGQVDWPFDLRDPWVAFACRARSKPWAQRRTVGSSDWSFALALVTLGAVALAVRRARASS